MCWTIIILLVLFGPSTLWVLYIAIMHIKCVTATQQTAVGGSNFDISHNGSV